MTREPIEVAAQETRQTSRPMLQEKRERIHWGGIAGITGGLSGILLSPVVTAAGNLKWGADLPWEGHAPAWLNPFRSLIEPLLALPPKGEVYSTYGKAFFFG